MTLDEFYKCLDKMVNLYGDKAKLNSYQAQIYFEKLKPYTADKLQRAIEGIYETSKYAPSLGEILEKIRNLKVDTQTTEKVNCKMCIGTGYILQNRIIDNVPYTYAVLCTCQNAKGKEYDGSKIADKEHRSQFYIETAENAFINNK